MLVYSLSLYFKVKKLQPLKPEIVIVTEIVNCGKVQI